MNAKLDESLEYEPEEFKLQMMVDEKKDQTQSNKTYLHKNQLIVFLLAMGKTFLVCFV
jgi:hypothetical protein